MKKIIIIAIAVIAVIFLYNEFVDGDGTSGGDAKITGYQGQIESMEGNVLKLTSGLKVELIGVKSGRTDIKMYVENKYIGQNVYLIADSKEKQTFGTTDETVPAYVILEDDGNKCLNHIILNECNDALDVSKLNDSIQWASNVDKLTPIDDIALYMKQRSFLIVDKEAQTIGTGFFINADGLALTNWHVLKPGKEDVSVAVLYENNPDDSQIYSKKKRRIKNILDSSPLPNGLDVTIFSVELEQGENVPYFNLVKRHINVGERCATFGNPEGLTASFSDGSISAYRPDDDRQDVQLVQYTIGTNGGNSGGAVCEEKYGQVIAIHEMGMKDKQGLNFGIDILQVRMWLDELGLKYGNK